MSELPSSGVSTAPVKKKRSWPILVVVYIALIFTAIYFFQLYDEQKEINRQIDCSNLLKNVSYEFSSGNKNRACFSWIEYKSADCKTNADTLLNYNEYCRID